MVFFRGLMLALGLIIMSATTHAAGSDVPKSVSLVAHLIGPDGAPVTDARVWLHQSVLKNSDDIVLKPSAAKPGEYRYVGPLPKDTKYPAAPSALVAQSPSGAVAYALTTIKTFPAEFNLRLPKTRPVRVKVEPWKDAPALPADARLTAIPDPLASVIKSDFESGGNLVAGVREGDDTFVVSVDSESTQTRVRFESPGYLRMFLAPPLKPGEETVTIELPEPGGLKISYAPAERFKATPPYDHVTVVLSQYERLTGNNPKLVPVGAFREDKKGTNLEFNFPDLAPGQYFVVASVDYDERDATGAKGASAGEVFEQVIIRSGKTETVAMEYDDIDYDHFRGNLTADLTVLMPDGKPAKGQNYRLTIRDRQGHFGVLTSGTVTEDGKVLLKGLTRGFDDQTTDGKLLVNYELVVGEREGVLVKLYNVDMPTKTFHATSEPLVLEIKLPPDVGDLAPDVVLQKMDGTGSLRIAEFRSKVLVLDFWATWCGPCQEPMEHLNVLAVENADRYKDNVVLIGASIDEELKTLQDHVRKNRWDQITQTWCAPEGDENSDFQSPAASAYGIRGVPTTFIIDREGKIVWRGHPAGLDEDMINKMAEAK